MREKVVEIRKRGYIKPGEVKSLFHYFCVHKGLSNIRMVYNGAGCGLNEAVWAPHVGLQTARQTLRSLLPGYEQCNMDVGEMFLNFLLHKEMKQISGVEVAFVHSEDSTDAEWEAQQTKNWERWCRNWMGLRDSPYRSIQHMIRLKFVAYEDRQSSTTCQGRRATICHSR